MVRFMLMVRVCTARSSEALGDVDREIGTPRSNVFITP